MLEITFYYCLILKEEANTTMNILPQKKSKNQQHVRLFDDHFLIEITNTVFSYLSILYKTNGTINLNRLSSNPLEHTFGLIRMRSRYTHTYEKAIKSLGKIEMLKTIRKIVQPGENIQGRKSYFKLNILSIYYRCYPNDRKHKLSTTETIKIKGNLMNRFRNINIVMDGKD